MEKRVFLIVLDSFGIGAEPDAAAFGDAGTNTLGAIAKHPNFHCPNLQKLGLFNIDGVTAGEKTAAPAGAFARLQEQSMGKDTTIGHWEIAGVVSPKPLPTFPNGFPEELIHAFEEKTGHKVLCNKPYSGTQVLKDYGEQAMKENALIVYTSADSVFQVAANEELVPVHELYRYCEIAREMLKGEYGVGRVIARDNRIQLMINPPCGGILPLRNAIVRYLGDFRGMKVAPHQIIIGAGTEYLYGLLIQLLGKNLIYGVENPGYHKIGKICKSMGVTYRHVDLDESGVSIHELEEKKIDIIHTSPSHHFPTGLVMPVSRRYELLGWAAKKKQHYIIEDDYDSELRLSGKPFPTLQSIDVSGKVIYMNTFTKTLASTVRISYMVLPEDLAKRFYSELSFYSCTVSNFEQYTLAQFMENGSFEKHINRLRNYYQNKRDAILKELKSGSSGKYITIQEEEAGVHFLMHIQSDCTEAEIVEKAKAGGVKLDPLSRYYIKNTEKHEQNGQENPYENTYVMNYSSINMENIKKVVHVLSQLG